MSRPIVVSAVVAGVVVLIAALYYLFGPSSAPPTGGPVPSADRGDAARETIAELRESGAEGQVDYDEAFAQAEAHRREGRIADAHVLYFFAARNGHARAAFEYAAMHDPLHHDPATSLLPEPDPVAAYKWYAQALEGGVPEAAARLDALHEWAEEQAANGNYKAEQLLLQWD